MDIDRRHISSTVDADSAGTRLDVWLAQRFSYHSLSKWLELINDRQLLVNDSPAQPEHELLTGDVITYLPRDLREPPVDFNYSIDYEDEYFYVVNKSGNLPCHPAGPFFKHTLWHHLSSRAGKKVYVVNRLDRETSGLLIVAKDPKTAGFFSGRSSSRIEKEYRALVFGCFKEKIDALGYLIRDPDSIVRKKQRFVFAGQLDPDTKTAISAETLLEPVTFGDDYSLVAATLQTGRTHQVRATLYSLGFPLLGDKLYGPDDRIYLKIREQKITPEDHAKLILPRQALHSYRIKFAHPVSGKNIELKASIPADFDITL